MCRKLIGLVSFVLVLGPVLTSIAKGADPDIVGWWRLDEGSGAIARDSSGNGNHATFQGAPQWVAVGKLGRAVMFNGSTDYLAAPDSDSLDINGDQLSLAAWINGEAWPAAEHIVRKIADTEATPIYVFRVQPDSVRVILSTSAGQVTVQGATTLPTNEWIHVALAYDGAEARIYVNGQLDASSNVSGTLTESSNELRIGRGDPAGYFDGMIDDARVYSRALTQEEIAQVMIGVDPVLASDPNPADTATDVPRDVILGWTPGEYAGQHDVYFGASFDDVNNATNLDPIGPDKVYRARQGVNSYGATEILAFGQTYYWRVDEVNAPPTSHVVFKGSVWSFTVEPFAYPIDSNNITATASSSFDATTSPENTVNGSGLDADDLHSVEQADIWLTDMTAQPPIWIQYEFDKVYKLHEMWVWNFNQVFEVIVGFGLKDVTIEYSANGIDWTELAGVPEFAQAPGMPGYAHDTTVDFGGVTAKYVKITANDNWGFLTQYGLSEVRFFYIPVWATEPAPYSGATNVGLDATLGFRAGREAAKHDVYLGTDEQAVIDGTAPVTAVSQTSYGPLSLDLGRTYYWRVDEVNDAETPTTWQGDIWDFATQEYFVVEDFESYDDYEPNRIFDTWTDGWGVPTNGSTIGYPNPIFVQGEHFAETTITHSGGQSTPLFYENTAGAAFSEATRTVDTTKDWTQAGVKTLTLWFYGDWTNPPAQIYVKVDGVKVTYDGDMSDVQVPSWHQWDIELASLAGVNLRNVNQIAIGVEGSGSGVVYLDDIRLYSSRCVASRLQPQADLNDDCVVDYQDLDILSSDWLLTDDVIATMVPSEANKELHLQLDGSLLDSSPNARTGYIMPATATAAYVTGKTGQAIYLDGSNYVEMTGYKGILGANPFSVAAWIRTTDNEGEILGWGLASGGQRAEFRVNANRLRCEHGNGNVQGDTNVSDGEWHHVAVTVIENATISHPDVKLYLDGRDDTRQTTDPDVFNVNANFDVKMGQRYNVDNTRWFTGMLDDVRLYSRTLSGAEVAYLADASPADGQLYVPVPSVAELSSGEHEGSKVIDLKDYAIFGDQWLDEQLWP